MPQVPVVTALTESVLLQQPSVVVLLYWDIIAMVEVIGATSVVVPSQAHLLPAGLMVVPETKAKRQLT